mgnify:FL=1
MKIIKLPYSGCSIIQEEVIRIYTTIYGGAYSSSDLNDPIELGTLGGGEKFDSFNHNFKRRKYEEKK